MAITDLIPSLSNRRTGEADYESPVFLFAATHRTGSTLLQRIVNASGEIFLWGEPHFVPDAAALYRRLIRNSGKSLQDARKVKRIGVGEWIPTVYPSERSVSVAFRALFLDLYTRDLANTKYKRWGFKDVAPRAGFASRVLFELFPGARFVFLIRHPLNMYRSVKGMPFFKNFKDPYRPVDIWNDNCEDFMEILGEDSLPAMLIRYEDLVAGGDKADQTIEALCRHLQVPVKKKMWRELKVRSGPSTHRYWMTAEDKKVIRDRVSDTARKIGYRL